MSARTPEELEKLKAQLREASEREQRDPAERAKGLDRLLAAEAAAPPSGASGRAWRGRTAAAAVAVGLLAAWWLLRPTGAVVTPPGRPALPVMDAPTGVAMPDAATAEAELGPPERDLPETDPQPPADAGPGVAKSPGRPREPARA